MDTEDKTIDARSVMLCPKMGKIAKDGVVFVRTTNDRTMMVGCWLWEKGRCTLCNSKGVYSTLTERGRK
jgi:hypothetical protein